MAQSISDNPKKRGRPKTTGRGTLIGVRLLDTDLAALDAHIAAQPEPKPTRPEAIRRVLAKGLK
jgi:cytochrome c553